MKQNNPTDPAPDGRTRSEQYEAPKLERLGALSKLTAGPNTSGRSDGGSVFHFS